MIEYEKFLAPWEADKDGKPLDEPAEIEPGRLKKYLYNLLLDKEKTQEKVSDVQTELASAKETLATVQREHENEEQRRAREEKEREQRYEKLEKEATERRKVETIEAAFEKEGITAARARKLAKKVSGDDEQAWLEDARELVEDGFRISDKPAGERQVADEEEEILEVRPKVVRSNGTPTVSLDPKRKKTITEELDEAIPIKGW